MQREKLAGVPERTLIGRSILLRTTLVLSLDFGPSRRPVQSGRDLRFPGTGASAEIPVYVRQERSCQMAIGRRFYADDRRADLTVQSAANPGNDSPARLLAKKKPRSGILYKRVRPSFFRVRCNEAAFFGA